LQIKEYEPKGKKMRYIISLLAVALFTHAIPAWSASFDCSKASTYVEEMICDNVILSKLDERMAKAYFKSREIMNPNFVKNDQISWIKLRNKCLSNICINALYNQRLSELAKFDYEYTEPLISYETYCKSEDFEYAKFWDNYYSPEAAYKFGLTIQKAILNKDINTIFSFVSDELDSGPRKSFALSSDFDEIFSNDFITSVTDKQPSCSPVGWRGFDLGNGDIWYNCTHSSCGIFRINVGNVENIPLQLGGWKINDETVNPKCLAYNWWSGDNFEEFAEKFRISDYADFSKNTGKYFGNYITNYDPIKPDWCDEDKCEISLIRSLENCSEPLIVDTAKPYIIEADDLRYTVVDKEIEDCSSFASHFPNPINECKLISIFEDTGGSMGSYRSYGIYGISEMPDTGSNIIPLKFFDKFNDALNFLDEIKK
tara:strand:- start:176 stop:1459 length:1284 start_codon:yes stop_codon:yes gene_type:complete